MHSPLSSGWTIFLLELNSSWKGHDLQQLIQPSIIKNARGTLQKTLRCYIDCHGNTGTTAKSLHIHRYTLNYRLGKIERWMGRHHDGISGPAITALLLTPERVEELLLSRNSAVTQKTMEFSRKIQSIPR